MPTDTFPLGPAVPRRRRRWWVWLIVLIVLPLALFGIRKVQESRAQTQLQAAIALADADDPQWRLEQMQEQYERLPINEHLVATLLALPKSPAYRGWYGDDILDRPGAQPYRLETYPNARLPEQYLTLLRERNTAPLLAPLRRAMNRLAGQPGGRLPNTYRTNTGRLLDDLRYLMNVHSDDVLLATHEQRYEDAIRSIRQKLELGEATVGCPSLIVDLVRIATRAGTFQHVQTLLAHGQLTPDQLARLQALVMRYDATDALPLARLLRAEIHHDLLRLQTDAPAREEYWKNYYPPLPANTSTAERVMTDAWRYLDRQLFTQSLTHTHVEVLESLNSHVAKTRLNRDIREAEETWVNKSEYVKKQLAVATKITSAQATLAAQLRSASVALACERYRLAHGNWPAALQDLVPQYLPRLPMDPYSGEPLLYRVLPDGVVVYSVSRNHTDDGGKVLYLTGIPLDRGLRLYNPMLRGLKYEKVYMPNP